jgi:DNA modification methylase
MTIITDNRCHNEYPAKLDGKTWLRYSISIWDDVKTSEERAYGHPAMFPCAMTDKLLEIFNRGRGIVLDPFMGGGSTICSAYSKDMPSVGFELSGEYLELTKKRLEGIQGAPEYYPRLINDSSSNILQYLAPESVGFCVTSPPYWDILSQKHTADGKTIRNYGNDPDDLGNIERYDDFLGRLQAIFQKVYVALEARAYCIVVVMDIRKKSVFYPLHMDVTGKMLEIGFTFDDIIIWDRRQEYNNLRPLGYPSVFRINKVHEFILIFQKR